MRDWHLFGIVNHIGWCYGAQGVPILFPSSAASFKMASQTLFRIAFLSPNTGHTTSAPQFAFSMKILKKEEMTGSGLGLNACQFD